MAKPRTGAITPLDTPIRDDRVTDHEYGVGVVTKQMKGGGLWVKFPGFEEPQFYTLRTRLNEWRLFPGPASRPGLQIFMHD